MTTRKPKKTAAEPKAAPKPAIDQSTLLNALNRAIMAGVKQAAVARALQMSPQALNRMIASGRVWQTRADDLRKWLQANGYLMTFDLNRAAPGANVEKRVRELTVLYEKAIKTLEDADLSLESRLGIVRAQHEAATRTLNDLKASVRY